MYCQTIRFRFNVIHKNPVPMKKTLLLCWLCMLMVIPLFAQMCPGGGVDFSSAVSFDPSWIYGCNTGTSCNGGTAFDNRTACLPVTAMDACAPAPSCGVVSHNASNVWFKFYASSSTAVISCFQNTSLVLGLQAFKGGPLCGSLTELGCALSSGPSSGVQLHLTGLSPGILYYFRIFGSATPVSQRTGLYCFCGSTGLGNYLILPAVISQFTANAAPDKIAIEWTVSNNNSQQNFEIQRSDNGNSFTRVANFAGDETMLSKTYRYIDESPAKGINYYRLKIVYPGDHIEYSKTISANTDQRNDFSVLANPATRQLQVTVSQTETIKLLNISGQVVTTLHLAAGTTFVSTAPFAEGVYVLQTMSGSKAQKFYVYR